MNLANIVFILAGWCAFAIVAGILMGTMMASKDESFADTGEVDPSIHRAA
jgi:hypothetical protein